MALVWSRHANHGGGPYDDGVEYETVVKPVIQRWEAFIQYLFK